MGTWTRAALAGLLCATAQPAIAYTMEAHGVPVTPVVFGDFVEFTLDPKEGWVSAPGRAERFAAHAYEIDVFNDEALSIGYRGTGQFYVTFLRKDPEGDKNRPGWKSVVTYPLSDTKTDKTSFVGFGPTFTGKPGHYRIEFWAAKPEATVSGRVWIYGNMQFSAAELHSDGLPDKATLRAKWDEAALHPLDPAIATPERRAHLPRPAIVAMPLPHEGEAYVAGKPEALRPFFAALYADGEQNAVLNFEKLGLAAMEAGQFKVAEWAFDRALERIEAVYANDPAAKAARSKWAAEAIKDFKGEPYERSMAYYYRGLLYLRAADYDNARAAFLSAEFQDTVSESEEYQGDFALMDYLAGWAAQCAGAGSNARDSFALAAKVDPRLAAPAADANRLVLAELGQGPVKVQRGGQRQLLTFTYAQDQGTDERADAVVAPAGVAVPLQPVASLSYQAFTRGSRPVDFVLQGKANFQNNTALAADLLRYAAQSVPVLAVPMAVFAVLSGKTQTVADIRMWDSLPDRIALAAIHAPGGLSFRYASPAAARAEPWMEGGDQRCRISWSRSRSAIALGAGTPGADTKSVARRSNDQDMVRRNTAFRAALTQEPVALSSR